MQNLKNMMTRVGNGVSKNAAANTENAWAAIRSADFSESGSVRLDSHSFATVYKYLEACAKKCGVTA